MNKPDPIKTTQEIWKAKFPDSTVIFLAGSVVRKEETPYSDLDLVVVYKELTHAWRESFMFQNWHVEAFVHDPQTLKYFFEDVDAKSGCPSLPQMVSEGIAIPQESGFSKEMKALADSILRDGPPKLSEEDLEKYRYGISDLLDDLRSPRNKQEAMATGTRLYQSLSDFWLRSQDKWSASGKTIPRVLKKADETFSEQFHQAFEKLFSEGDSGDVVSLTEQVLSPFGGYLFDGHKLDAPEDWKK